ncbi:MAG: hypothetical protein ACRD4B_07935 [Acidobacteriota bacterium]
MDFIRVPGWILGGIVVIVLVCGLLLLLSDFQPKKTLNEDPSPAYYFVEITPSPQEGE